MDKNTKSNQAMRYLLVASAVSLFVLPFILDVAKADTAVSISYGTVEQAQTIKKEASHAGGAIVGGLLGAAISGPRHRGLKILGSSAAGAAVQGAATGGMVQQYQVRLRNGSEVLISTEQADIRIGDCVSVEQGRHANIRRASSIHCESKQKTTVPVHHETGAKNCQAAKDELTAAHSDDDIEMATKKVRILCED